MQVIKLTGQVDSKGYVHLDVPTQLSPGLVDIVIVIDAPKLEEGEEGKQKYNFSDIAGKLTWEGDAVVTQRQIRNEW